MNTVRATSPRSDDEGLRVLRRPVQHATGIVARFRDELAPGGLLFVGLSESLTGLEHDDQPLSPGVCAR